MKIPKKSLLFRVGLVVALLGIAASLFVYGQLVIATIIRDPWIRQSIGNYLDSSLSSKEKHKIGMENCSCPMLTINTKEKVQLQWNSIREDLLTNRLRVRRVRYLLTGQMCPYVFEPIMPDMNYDEGKIIKSQSEQPVKIKLTGGQIDHFDSKRVSIRVKSDSPIIESINQVNFYNPKAREGGVTEWFATTLMRRFGLISLRTGYADLSVNGSRGLYFFQEHPSIHMLNDTGLKPGLIVRVECRGDANDQRNHVKITGIYDEGNLAPNVVQSQLSILTNKVIDVNANLTPVSQLFSLVKLAKFCAVIDLVNGYHAAEFRNAFFYFNPEDSLLEPIGREFGTNYYMTNGPYHRPIRHHFVSHSIINGKSMFVLEQLFMQSSDADFFTNQYLRYLQDVSRKSFLDSVFVEVGSDLKERQACLYLGNPEFASFDPSYYYKNQNLIEKYLVGDFVKR